MGNSASSSGRGPHDDTVDFGFLTPQGVYTGQRDWNESIVGQLICERKLAPFYRPLEDYDPSWDDERILAARKEPPNPNGDATESIRSEASGTSKHGHHKRPSNVKDVARSPEAAIYRGAVECPICFLVRPSSLLMSPSLAYYVTVNPPARMTPTSTLAFSSITPLISTSHDVAIKPFVPNVLSKSNAPSPPSLISSLIPHAVHIVSKSISVLYILLLDGVQVLEARDG